MTMKIKVDGFEELDRALKDLGDEKATKRIARHALKKAAKPIANDAASSAPRDEDDSDGIVLAESIRVSTKLNPRQKRIQKRHQDRGAVEVYVGVANEASAYGHHQEFGTEHHAPQPFLRPAWEAGKMRVLDTIKSELWAGIKRQARRSAKSSSKKSGSAASAPAGSYYDKGGRLRDSAGRFI